MLNGSRQLRAGVWPDATGRTGQESQQEEETQMSTETQMTDEEKAIADLEANHAVWGRHYNEILTRQIQAVIEIARRAIATPEPTCAMCDGKPVETGTAGCKDCNQFAEDSLRPVESPDDWVTQDRVPARPGIDQRAYQSPRDSLLEWEDSACIDWDKPARHGDKINGDTLLLRCRRVDLPAMESQDDWVPQDIASSRPGIDQWRFIDGDGKSTEWFQALPGFSRSHGDIIEGHRYEVRCRRKDLPPKQIPVRLFFSNGFSRKKFKGRVYVTEGPIVSWDREIKISPDGKMFVEVPE